MNTLRRDNNRRHSTIMLCASLVQLTLPLTATTVPVVVAEAASPQPAEPCHWPYQRPVTPPLPSVHDAAWPQNAVDQFVLSQLEKERLAPSPATDRARLIRRLSL